jgi:hypothetical protein
MAMMLLPPVNFKVGKILLMRVELMEKMVLPTMTDILSLKKSNIHNSDILNIYCDLDVSSMPRMPPHSGKVLKPCLIFSNFKGDNCQKSLDQLFQPNKSWRMETENFNFFFVI